MNLYRSHNCGELNLNHIDKDVYISGWVNKKRDHGGLLFIDLRDEYGITQWHRRTYGSCKNAKYSPI